MVDAVRASIMKYEQQRGLRPWSPIPTCMPHQKLCEVCESAVVTVICEADAASLCTTCDTDIHSVNPLARRHLRVPIHQYQANKYFVEVTMTHGQNHHYQSENNTIHEDDYGDDEKEASSWILPEPAGKNLSSEAESESLLFRESEVDEYLDLVGYGDRQPYIDSKTQVQSYYTETDGADSVVPVQGLEMKLDRQNSGHQYLDLEFDNQKVGCYSSSTLEHSISKKSSIDVGIVPDATAAEYTSSYLIHSEVANQLSTTIPTTPIAPQMVLLDREARVLRYREKRKNRKFEKTIRYASRKAYAETRPRIKGRFAKRTDREVEVDQICPAAFMMEASYGVVPTF